MSSASERLTRIRSRLPYTYTQDVDWLLGVVAAAISLEEADYNNEGTMTTFRWINTLRERLYPPDKSTSHE